MYKFGCIIVSLFIFSKRWEKLRYLPYRLIMLNDSKDNLMANYIKSLCEQANKKQAKVLLNKTTLAINETFN